jgi:hypothetical protein
MALTLPTPMVLQLTLRVWPDPLPSSTPRQARTPQPDGCARRAIGELLRARQTPSDRATPTYPPRCFFADLMNRPNALSFRRLSRYDMSWNSDSLRNFM